MSRDNPSPPLALRPSARLCVPVTNGLLRPRLQSRLDGLLSARLGLVVAPAGFGKTTLMAQWAKRVPADVAWYRADPEDDTADAVIEQLGAALAAAHPRLPPARDLETLVAAVERHESPLVLVVDDLHLVESTHVDHLLQRLLLTGPPHLRLLVGSRRTSSFNLARTELPALVLREEDLRFRTGETAALFRDVYGRPLPTSATEQLTRQTHGWPAGLRLFHLSMPASRAHDRSLDLAAGEVRYARGYLDSEVLAAMPQHLVTFLRRTSCLETLTPERCDALLGDRTSRRMLAGLDDGGGMVHTVEGGKSWRLHAMLRGHLETQLLDGLDRPSALDWFRRAAAVVSDEEEYGAAARVLARVGDWPSLRELLADHGAQVVAEPTAWVEGVPPAVVESDPWLVLARARRHLDEGDLASAAVDAERAGQRLTDEEGRDRAARTRELARLWLDGAPDPQPQSWQGRLRSAATSHPLATAHRLTSATSPDEQLGRALAHALAGDLATARRMLRGAHGTLEDLRVRLAARLAEAALSPGSASLEALLDDDAADEHTWLVRIAEALAAAQDAVSRPGPPDSDLLVDDIEACDRAGDAWGGLLLAGFRAVALMRRGSLDERPFEDLLSRCRSLSCGTVEAWARSGLALVAGRAGLPEAAHEAEVAEAFARVAGVPGAMALAYAALATHRPAEAAELLSLADSTASDVGLVERPWTWLGGPTTSATSPHVPAPRATPSVIHEPPPLEVRCFGRFELRLFGVEPDLGRVRPRARAVLRRLALECGRPVHRELLVDALWHDLDADAGTHNLHVSVSSLRAALEPGVPRGASQVVVRDGERYKLAMPPASFSDIGEFDRQVSGGTRAWTTGDAPAAVTALDRAVELYTGEVLPEDGPAEWVLGLREHYRVRAAEAAATLAEVHLAQGDPGAAAAAALRSLDVDPCRDASWRLLIAAYTASADLAAAEQARRSYADVLTSLGLVSSSAAAVIAPTATGSLTGSRSGSVSATGSCSGSCSGRHWRRQSPSG